MRRNRTSYKTLRKDLCPVNIEALVVLSNLFANFSSVQSCHEYFIIMKRLNPD